MKKEDLLKENGTALAKLEAALARDKEIRQEFAKAFNWLKQRGPYGSEKELLNPSWNQIFVEIGRLQAAKTFYDLEGNVSELEHKVEEINRTLLKTQQD